MSKRSVPWCAVVVVVGCASLSTLAPAPAHGWQLERTAFGHPSLEGVWANNTATPMERPAAFAGKESLSAEELAALEARLEEIRESSQAGDLLGDFLIQRVLEDPEFRGFDQDTGNYNSFWLVERKLDERTSLVIDPPDGRIPAYRPEALQRLAARGGYADSKPAGPESLPANVRCISYGVPNILAGYNSYFKFVQTPTHVAIQQELIHDVRIIPIDGRPPLAEDTRFWHGDSRGRWEGDTLVVETRNYDDKGGFRGAGSGLTVIERFTRTAKDVLEWELTFDDDTTWERPWTMMIPLERSEDKIYEYACHEANYSLRAILAGARLEESGEAPSGE